MLLKDLIKTALKKAGLKEDLADELEKKVKSEEEIEDAVKELVEKEKTKSELTFDDLKRMIKEADLEELLEKYVKSEADRVVTKAIKSHDDKLKEKADEARKQKEAEEAKKKAEEKMSDEEKRWSKIEEMVKTMGEKVDTFLNKTSKDGLRAKVRAALKEAELDESFAEKLKIEKEEDIEATVTGLRDFVDKREQEKIDKKLEELGVPKDGNGQTTTPTEDMVADYAERKEKGEISGTFQGKDLGLGKAENLKE